MLVLNGKRMCNLASFRTQAAAISLVVANGGRALGGSKRRTRLRRSGPGLVVVAFLVASAGCSRGASESTQQRRTGAASSARVPVKRLGEIPSDRSPTPAATPSEPPRSALAPSDDSIEPIPWWRRVLESGDPSALSAARHAPEGEASLPGDKQGVADRALPETQDAVTTAKPAARRAPTDTKLGLRVLGKGPTYCQWSYYGTLHYLCTDADVSTALRRCSDYVARRFGAGMSCFCTQSEGYAPQCTGKSR